MIKRDQAEISVDEIIETQERVLAYARSEFGETVNARTVDLRLWAAASLIDSAIDVSINGEIMQSLEEKLEILSRARPT